MAVHIAHTGSGSQGVLTRSVNLPNYSAITAMFQFKVPTLPVTWTNCIMSWNRAPNADLVFLGFEGGTNPSALAVWTATGSAGGPRIVTSILSANTWYNAVLRGQTGAGGPLDLFVSEIGSPMTKYSGTYNGDGDFNGGMGSITFGNSIYVEPGVVTLQNIKIYNAVLTDAECANEVQQFLPERMNGMVGWWPLVDSVLDTNWKDYTGNGDIVAGGTGGTFTPADSAPLTWGGMVITMPGSATAAATQYARPISTVSSGAWTPSTGATLYETIDEESPNDADYNQVVSASTFEVKLSAVADPLSSVGHYVRYRVNGTGGANMTVELRCGATLIASWNHSPLPLTATTFEQTLSTGQADAITDYSDLRIRFISS